MKQSPYTRRGIMPFLYRHSTAAMIIVIAIYLFFHIAESTSFYTDFGSLNQAGLLLRCVYVAAAALTVAFILRGLRRWLEARAIARMRARRNAPEAPPNCPQCQYPLSGIAPVNTRVLGFWAERVVCPECGWAEP